MELLLKLVPVAVRVNAAVAAVLVVGLILDSVGTGLLTVNVRDWEVPPPGVGLNTVMAKLPPAATSAAVICAVN
jgi:hypothetical protein